MIGELLQWSQMNNAEDKARRAEDRAQNVEARARTAESEIGRLSNRVDALALACQSMWELLRDGTSLSDDDIRARMQEVDVRDGQADGRLRATVMESHACHRPVSSRRNACIYCGEEVVRQDVFDQ